MRRISIRDMLPQDVSSVVEIERVSFSTPWSESSFFAEVSRPHCIARVALLNDTVVGYICCEWVADEAHILNLAVHPDYRRMGIATALIQNIIDELRMRSHADTYILRSGTQTISQRGFMAALVLRSWESGKDTIHHQKKTLSS